MKLAAIILGVVGGVAGVLSALFVLLLPEEIEYFAGLETNLLVGLVIVAIIASITGIVGGIVAISRPRIAGSIMILSGIAGIIALSIGYVVAGPLLIVAGASARSASRRKPNAEVITLAPEEKELIEKEDKRTG